MIQLQPVAGPVDLFAPAEVRSTEDNRLAQVAQALGRFSGSLQALGDAVHERQKSEAFAEARKEHLQRQYKNRDELNAAVKRGDLKQADNPWFMAAMRQFVTRDQVRTGLVGLEEEFATGADDETAQVRQSQSVRALDGWIGKRVAKLTEGMDPFSLTAAADSIDEWRGGFIGQQQNKWERVRLLATEIGLSRELGHAIGPLAHAAKAVGPQTPEQSATLDEAWGRVQGVIDSAASVMADPEVIRKNAMQTLAALAISAESPEVLDTAMARLSIGGRALADLALPGEREQVVEGIEDSITRKYNRERFADSVRDEQAVESVLDLYQQARRQGGYVDPDRFQVELNTLSPEQQIKARQVMDQLAADDFSTQVSTTLSSTDVTGKGGLTLTEFLLQSSAPNATTWAERVMRLRSFKNTNEYPADTDFETRRQLEAMMDSERSAGSKYAVLTELITNGRVSRQDAEHFQGRILSLGRINRDTGQSVLSRYRLDTKNALLMSAMTDPAFQSQRELAMVMGGSGALPPEIEMQVETDLLRFNQAFDRYMADHPTPSLSDLEAHMKTVRDDLLKNKNTDAASSTAVGAVIRAHTDPDGAIASGEMVWKKDHFEIAVEGGSRRLISPKVLGEAGDVVQQFEQKTAALGITGDDAAAFVVDQAKHLSGADAQKLRDHLRAKTYGPKIIEEARDAADKVRGHLAALNNARMAHQAALSKGRRMATVYNGWWRGSSYESVATPEQVQKMASAASLLDEAYALLQSRGGPDEIKRAAEAIKAAEDARLIDDFSGQKPRPLGL